MVCRVGRSGVSSWGADIVFLPCVTFCVFGSIVVYGSEGGGEAGDPCL